MSAAKPSARKSLFEYATLVVLRGGISLSQFIIVVIAGTILDKTDFGRFAIVYAGARLLASFAGFGAPSFLLKDVPFRQAKGMPWHSVPTALKWFVALPLLICAIFGASLELIAAQNFTLYPLRSGEGGMLAATGFFWSLASLLGAWVRATRSSMEAMFVAEFAPPLALVAGIVAMWWLGNTRVAAIFLVCCGLLLVGQIVLLLLHAATKWIPVGGDGAQPIAFKDLTAYWWTVLLNTASTQLDILIAGVVAGPLATGIYALIKRITNIIAIPQSIVVWILAPRISRASALDDTNGLQAHARYATKMAFLPAIAIAALIGLTAPWWFAHFEIAWLPTNIAMLGLLLFANLFSVSCGQPFLFATQTGNPQIAVRALIWANMFSVIWLFAAGASMGIVAIAVGPTLMYAIINVYSRQKLKALYGIEISALNLLKKRSL